MTESLNPFAGRKAGPPIVRFEEEGDAAEGEILMVEYREDTKPDGTVKTFEDGRPRPMVVVHLRAADGSEVRDFVNGRSVTEFRSRVWAVEGEGEGPRQGANYKRTFTGLSKSNRPGYSPEKLYKIEYRAPEERELV